MRTVLVLLGIGCVLAGPAVADETYAPKEGKYTVKFPGKPKETTQSVKTKLGDLKVVTASYAQDEGRAFLVSYTDYPATAVNPETRRELLDGARNGLKGTDGKILTEKDAEFGPDKLAARELLIEKGKQHFRFLLVMRDSRMYQVAVVGPEKFVKGDTANKFVESFELKP